MCGCKQGRNLHFMLCELLNLYQLLRMVKIVWELELNIEDAREMR